MNDVEFYTYFDLEPIAILSDCEYDNLYRVHVHYGQDVCDYVDEPNHKCKDCKKGTPTYPYYPPVNEFILLQLILLVGIPDRVSRNLEQQKQDILNHVIAKCKNEEIKKDVVNLLKGYIQEYHSV